MREGFFPIFQQPLLWFCSLVCVSIASIMPVIMVSYILNLY